MPSAQTFLFPSPRADAESVTKRAALALPQSVNLVDYGDNVNLVEFVIDRIHNEVQETSGKSRKYICFACEWEHSRALAGGGSTAKIAVIQLCTPSGEVVVLQVLRLSKQIHHMFPKSLKALLEDDDILKVGAGIDGDAAKMERDWGVKVSRGWPSRFALFLFLKQYVVYDGRALFYYTGLCCVILVLLLLQNQCIGKTL